MTRLKKELCFIVLFFLVSILIVYADEQTFNQIYNIKGSLEWISGQNIELNLGNNTLIVFDNGEDTCELRVTSIQKLIKSSALVLKCGKDTQPVLIRKDLAKTVDIDYDGIDDIQLLLTNFNKKDDTISVSVNKIIPGKKPDNGPWTALIIIALIMGGGTYGYFYYKGSKSRYVKIKNLLEQLEDQLALNEYENSKKLYDEIKILYKKITIKQQKELEKQIKELFKEFEQQENNKE